MRIAYIAPYQGPSLLKARPVLRNLSLAGSVKMGLIVGLLNEKKNDVEIISQGEVIELQCKLYPSFCEPEPYHPDIPIFYASALPIKFLNGLWSSRCMLDILRMRHRHSPYDLVIIYNLKLPQIACADYAMRYLDLPVVFEYEDDAFVDIAGKKAKTRFAFGRDLSKLLSMVVGCMAASPHLLSQLPNTIPKLLLRGAVGHDIMQSSEQMGTVKKNWVLFSGTHHPSKGITQLITAWRELSMPDWELHITGHGELTNTLQKMVETDTAIVFHGLVSRQELVRLLCSAKVCINPHDISQTPGNIFAYKIIEYIAAGAHVVSTPMGDLEGEIESGMTYMPDNHPATIVAALKQVILGATWKRTARPYVLDMYGPQSISHKLDMFLQQASLYHESMVKKDSPDEHQKNIEKFSG